MLSQERIKLMVRLSTYEQGVGKNDIKISSYYKKDYVSFNTWMTILWVTLGYAVILGLYFLVSADTILAAMTIESLRYMGIAIFIIYGIVVAVFCIIGNTVYKRKHERSKERIKQYYKELSHLEKQLRKEAEEA